MRRHHRGRHLGICLAAGGLLACGDPGEKNDSIRSARLAFSVCDETVPADLFVDGIPAYDQCAASMDAEPPSAAAGKEAVRTVITFLASEVCTVCTALPA
mgnify:CR=1 FL=1